MFPFSSLEKKYALNKHVQSAPWNNCSLHVGILHKYFFDNNQENFESMCKTLTKWDYTFGIATEFLEAGM